MAAQEIPSGSRPQDMPKGSAFGPNLRALVIYLRFTQGIAFERLATLLSDLLGLDISEGALVNILDAAKDALPRRPRAIRAKLLDGTILQSDETGCGSASRTGGCGFSIMTTAPFSSRTLRAKKVVADFLGDFRPDFWVSDRYGGQMGWATVNNQVCLAISSATCNMHRRRRRHLRARASASAGRAADRAAKRKARRRDPETYARGSMPASTNSCALCRPMRLASSSNA